MKFYKEHFKVGQKVMFDMGVATITEVKEYPQQTDLVVKLLSGKLVQVEDWRVEKI